jgi:homogentisate 1,2-dioxygenase
MIYQIDFETSENRLFYVESFAPFTHQNVIKRIGQHLRTSAVLRAWFYFAKRVRTHDEKGDLIGKKEGMMH